MTLEKCFSQQGRTKYCQITLSLSRCDPRAISGRVGEARSLSAARCFPLGTAQGPRVPEHLLCTHPGCHRGAYEEGRPRPRGTSPGVGTAPPPAGRAALGQLPHLSEPRSHRGWARRGRLPAGPLQVTPKMLGTEPGAARGRAVLARPVRDMAARSDVCAHLSYKAPSLADNRL